MRGNHLFQTERDENAEGDDPQTCQGSDAASMGYMLLVGDVGDA